jgi:hypothetical protein
VIPFEAAIFAERLAQAPVNEHSDPPVPYVLSDLPAVRRPPSGLLALLPQVLQGVEVGAGRMTAPTPYRAQLARPVALDSGCWGRDDRPLATARAVPGSSATWRTG